MKNILIGLGMITAFVLIMSSIIPTHQRVIEYQQSDVITGRYPFQSAMTGGAVVINGEKFYAVQDWYRTNGKFTQNVNFWGKSW